MLPLESERILNKFIQIYEGDDTQENGVAKWFFGSDHETGNSEKSLSEEKTENRGRERS
jgi:hypothetical protein